MNEIVVSTRLAAEADVVWERVASLEGVNHELGPWITMTSPKGATIDIESVPLGERWFRSWLLFARIVPFDCDDLCVMELEPGRRFVERSRMLSSSVWEHERTLAPLPGGGTRVTDRVAFRSRLPFGARLHRAVIRAIFRHRHRRLLQVFGSG